MAQNQDNLIVYPIKNKHQVQMKILKIGKSFKNDSLNYQKRDGKVTLLHFILK